MRLCGVARAEESTVPSGWAVVPVKVTRSPTTDSTSLTELGARFGRSTLMIYAFNAPGQNHGLLLGAST